MRIKSFSGTVTVLALGGVTFLVYLYSLLFTPYQAGRETGIIEIPYGTNVQQTAQLLHEQEWIPSVHAFVFLVRVTGAQGKIRAGEYELSPSMSPREILTLLRKGSVVLHRVTIPEGLRGVEVAAIVAEKLGLSEERFVNLLTDPELIRVLGLDAPSFEGYLLPETYSFPKTVTEEQVIRKMAEETLVFFDEGKKNRAASLGMDLDEILTLASIIEKEMGVESEGPLISSVYHNRLKKKMRLQSDPTVIYGIRDFDGNLRRRDLKQDTPYNTYVRSGLPPTPIANPGKVAVLAALYPSETKYLYFVSRNDKTHAFSETLTAHNRAVDRYQKRRR